VWPERTHGYEFTTDGHAIRPLFCRQRINTNKKDTPAAKGDVDLTHFRLLAESRRAFPLISRLTVLPFLHLGKPDGGETVLAMARDQISLMLVIEKDGSLLRGANYAAYANEVSWSTSVHRGSESALASCVKQPCAQTATRGLSP
jgi:hypothetical protein